MKGRGMDWHVIARSGPLLFCVYGLMLLASSYWESASSVVVMIL